MRDYSKLKALAQEMIKCIGDEPEGGDGTDVSHSEEERGDMGETGIADKFNKAADTKKDKSTPADGENHKKRKDDVIALFASTLASKFNK